MKIRCFIDVNGQVWTINNDGKSNHPSDILIEGDTVLILGVEDDIGPGREVEDEYVVWPSLTALANAIEA